MKNSQPIPKLPDADDGSFEGNPIFQNAPKGLENRVQNTKKSLSATFGINPQEGIWQFMRDNWLSNRVFTSYENILDHCCEAWNKLTDQPWRIMTIGQRDWVYGF